jgi:hypothetical protein
MNKGGQIKCFCLYQYTVGQKSIRTIDRTFRRLQNGIFKVFCLLSKSSAKLKKTKIET